MCTLLKRKLSIWLSTRGARRQSNEWVSNKWVYVNSMFALFWRLILPQCYCLLRDIYGNYFMERLLGKSIENISGKENKNILRPPICGAVDGTLGYRLVHEQKKKLSIWYDIWTWVYTIIWLLCVTVLSHTTSKENLHSASLVHQASHNKEMHFQTMWINSICYLMNILEQIYFNFRTDFF